MKARQITSGSTIVGPVLPHLTGIGLGGNTITLATAFYSRRALSYLKPTARCIRFMCRLSLDSTREWELGCIDPHALLDFADAQIERGCDFRLWGAEKAHAKVYVGQMAALIGSANLTLAGFGGGHEILELVRSKANVRRLNDALDQYAKGLSIISVDELRDYVERNRSKIAKRKILVADDRIPLSGSGQLSVGDYEDFKTWLGHESRSSAAEVLARAEGKHNLSGHINRNFYGLRQFFISFPEQIESFVREDPDQYKLTKDPETESKISDFVAKHAVDEGDFSLDRWRTYLPVECGGRAKKHGGTIGNLNFMLPLVAKYLHKAIKSQIK